MGGCHSLGDGVHSQLHPLPVFVERVYLHDGRSDWVCGEVLGRAGGTGGGPFTGNPPHGGKAVMTLCSWARHTRVDTDMPGTGEQAGACGDLGTSTHSHPTPQAGRAVRPRMGPPARWPQSPQEWPELTCTLGWISKIGLRTRSHPLHSFTAAWMNTLPAATALLGTLCDDTTGWPQVTHMGTRGPRCRQATDERSVTLDVWHDTAAGAPAAHLLPPCGRGGVAAAVSPAGMGGLRTGHQGPGLLGSCCPSDTS